MRRWWSGLSRVSGLVVAVTLVGCTSGPTAAGSAASSAPQTTSPDTTDQPTDAATDTADPTTASPDPVGLQADDYLTFTDDAGTSFRMTFVRNLPRSTQPAGKNLLVLQMRLQYLTPTALSLNASEFSVDDEEGLVGAQDLVPAAQAAAVSGLPASAFLTGSQVLGPPRKGATLDFYLPFRLAGHADLLSFGSADTGNGTSWHVYQDHPPLPAQYGAVSGSGSQLVRQPGVPADVTSVQVCVRMTGSGNNIVESQSDPSGSDADLLVNVVGPVQDCVSGTPAKYYQVLSDGSWTVTVKPDPP